MSTYENYSETAKVYDRTRVPIGIEILVGCFAQANSPLSEMVVLDAGCGTGAYAERLLEHPLVGVELVDANEGMLAVARAKLAEAVAAERAALRRAELGELPFDDGTFDAVMVNQVLHHLDAPDDHDFPEHARALAELARVLRPGGVLVVNTCAHHQLDRGAWPNALIPEATERMKLRYLPLARLQEAMVAAGLTPRGRFVPVDAVVQGEAYFDPRGPLEPAWRKGDSIWTHATPEELARVLERVRAMDVDGSLEAFVAEHDAERPLVGQITFVLAVRQ